MTVSTSKNGMKSGMRTDVSASSPEPPARGLVSATSIHSRDDLTDLPVPHYLFVTPFWFRVFVAGLTAVAAVMVLRTRAHPARPGDCKRFGRRPADGGRCRAGDALCGMAFRFCNPLDRRKWFHLALPPDGLYFPGRKSSLVLVPWSASSAQADAIFRCRMSPVFAKSGDGGLLAAPSDGPLASPLLLGAPRPSQLGQAAPAGHA